MNKVRKIYAIVAGILLMLVAIRVYLPYAIQDYVNKTLDRHPEYDGRIGDIDLYLWRGAYNIDGIKIVKTTGKVPVPFFEAENVDLSVQWAALLEGKAVGEIYLDRPVINFVAAPSEKQSQTTVGSEWLQIIKDLFPLRINHFKASNGAIHYRDFHSDPKVNVVLSDLTLEGRNFSNSRSPTEGLQAEIQTAAKMEGHAPFNLSMRLAPSAEEPRFDMELSLRSLDVTQLNDFLNAYAAVDAESGKLGLDAEVATSENRFKGQIKPIAENLEVFSLEKDTDNPLETVWEGFVGLWNQIFQNQRHEQLAASIPFSGSLDDPEADIWSTIASVLHNAFIEALKPGTNNQVDIKDVS